MHFRTLPRWLFASALTLIPGAIGCTEDASSSGAAGSQASSSTSAEATGTSSATTSGGSEGMCEALSPSIVTMTTEDGVTLEADLYTTGKKGGPGAVLLHMIPPSNDRTNFPTAFIEALVAKGVTVLNVDRRGAGGSTGVAKEAYTGPNGKLDAKAAASLLTSHACAIDPARIAFVGASNGTTTALDFAVHAEGQPSDPAPKALVFLTGGTYTENQNAIKDHRPLLDPRSILFVFSTAERGWSVAFEPGAPPTWVFKEYPSGAHGTGMFIAAPESIEDVASFLGEHL